MVEEKKENASGQDQLQVWEDRWGPGMSEREYRQLDWNYRNLAAEYKGAITPRLHMNLLDIARWRLKREQAVESGDTQSAKRLTDMIKATMDSEAMKAGDQKATEAMRVDGLVTRLEERGMLKDGVLILDKVIDYVQKDSGRFNMSRDAVDHMILSIINAQRFNSGLTEWSELPDDVKVQDTLGEFLDSPTRPERDMMIELGMVPETTEVTRDGI